MRKMLKFQELQDITRTHVYSILPRSQLNKPLVPSLSQTRLWGTRNLQSNKIMRFNNIPCIYKIQRVTHIFPSTKKTSRGKRPSSGSSFPISLSLKSSSSNFHSGTFRLPLNASAKFRNPSSSENLLPLSRR